MNSTKVGRYLLRINFRKPLKANLNTLKSLHRQHLLHVPFENLDVHFRRPFDLAPANVYDKVVNRKRGGFCYEVNSLFNDLLRSAGFKTKIISGRVITDAGQQGPEYDHMAIIVSLDDKEFIADVGFGDLFIEPIEVNSGVQFDGRNYFKIVAGNDLQKDENECAIYMSPDNVHFHKKYTFTLAETPVNLFEAPCREKQVSPDSHFVKNTICTQLTEEGRITVYNEKFTETVGDQKMQSLISNDVQLKEILKKRFGILMTAFLLITSFAFGQRFDFKVCIPDKDTIEGLPVYNNFDKETKVDVVAEPEGGLQKFYSMISRLIYFPEKNKRTTIDSNADLTFIIDTKGRLRNFCFFRKEYWAIDEAALYKNTPPWKPALIGGQPVPYRMIVPMIVDVK